MREINWERLKNIGPNLRPFQPTEENRKFLSQWLLKGFLVMSDEGRTRDKVDMWMGYCFPYHLPYEIRPFHVIYEVGDFAGLIGFMDIVVGHKASVLFKYWKPEIWSHKIFRDLKSVQNVIMEELELERLSLRTADLRGVKLAKKMGYVVEGRQAIDFKWNGKYYTTHLLRRLSPEREKKRQERRTHQKYSEPMEEQNG